MKLTQIHNYLTEKKYCFIPKCLAQCCADAPLPEDFLPKHRNEIQRRIYAATNIGQNDPHDTFNSIIYKTTPNPIQFIGFDVNGQKLFGILPEMVEHLQIESMEQINDLLVDYKKHKNYCPFLTNVGSCGVYEKRPTICREFGTLPNKINQCPDKASKLDIVKTIFKDLFNYKRTFLNIKEMFSNLGKSTKTQKA